MIQQIRQVHESSPLFCCSAAIRMVSFGHFTSIPHLFFKDRSIPKMRVIGEKPRRLEAEQEPKEGSTERSTTSFSAIPRRQAKNPGFSAAISPGPGPNQGPIRRAIRRRRCHFLLRPESEKGTSVGREPRTHRPLPRHPPSRRSGLEPVSGFPFLARKATIEFEGLEHDDLTLAEKAARTLFLNRTCFKGMWRHNSSGQFNVGYGGQDRRWTVDSDGLKAIGAMLRRTVLRCDDFEDVIDECTPDDYVFLDPPYRPGERDMPHDHYAWSFFRYGDHERLAKCLRSATKRKVKWAITTTSHPEVLKLFRDKHDRLAPWHWRTT